ncbi:MAG: DUF1080 domain-containing protein [Saprospiraceae bacterium]|nr:DUF1080 domain-containing protein [Saprospiraceae bacterium]
MCKKTPSAAGLLVSLFCSPFFSVAQTNVSLADLSFWKADAQRNWQIAGSVSADLSKPEAMTASKGTGVLVNLPDAKNRANLLSANEYGDVDVSFDFMMAARSNSGFYLQGRYEVQLLDSWGVKNPRYGDCGGIYARRRFVPQEQMFEGTPPRQNACLAPGLWQRMEISFQAPRFDATGKKIANARVLKVVLNGVLIHDNIELTGPTGGPISEQEAATGPFMIQGDHGPVAFRNFVVNDRRGEPPVLGKIAYKAWQGDFRATEDFLSKKPDTEGVSEHLTWELAGDKDGYALVFSASMKAPRAGLYHFTTQTSGRSILKVNGREILDDAWTWAGDKRQASIELAAGNVPLEWVCYKTDDWMPPMLAFWVEAPGSPKVAFHSLSSTLALEPSDPIYLEAPKNTVFRSFMDFYPDGQFKKRIVHAVHVGSPEQLHYTYDLDNGALAQIWKGEFLYTSPMWDDRGDGSSRPMGALLTLHDISSVVPRSTLFDTTSSKTEPVPDFRPKGYDLDANDQPTFRYQRFGMDVEDHIRVSEGKYLTRTLTVANPSTTDAYVCRLALGKEITKVDDSLYLVDDRRYYVRLPQGEKPNVERSGDLAVLYVPLKSKVEYAILW